MKASPKASYESVRQGYTAEKARATLVNDLWGHFVIRPISLRLTPLFINLGFSANVVTVLGLMLLICGLVFILLGAVNPFNFIIGAVFINIYVLFDHIDGNIARFWNRCSMFGEFLDNTIGMAFHTFLPVCLGLALFFNSSERSIFTMGIEVPRWFWLAAGAVGLGAGLFRKVVNLRFQVLMGSQVGKTEHKIAISTVLPRAILSLKEPLLMIASLVGALGFFLVGYALYDLALLLVMIALFLRKALLIDRWRSQEQPGKGEKL